MLLLMTGLLIITGVLSRLYGDDPSPQDGEEKSKDIEEFMVDELGITIECFRQLTSKYLKQFNVDNLDDPNVKYYSYGGSKAKARDISVMYQIPYQIPKLDIF